MEAKAQKKVLLVDDEKEALFLLEKILKRHHFEVYATPKGKEAISLAKMLKPDLILLDIVMPDIDGGDVAAALSEDETTKDIPIIFLTALMSEQEEPYLKDKVPYRYVAKPIDEKRLLDAIREIFY